MVKREHIRELDLLRGISAVLVMLFHYTTQYDRLIGHIAAYPINIPWGNMGVSVFFILSGFLTTMNLRKNATMLNFAFRRIIRLYPVYWVAIIITTVTMVFLLPEWKRSTSTILINLTMLQGFLDFESVDGVYWTLMNEILFYCYVGIIILFKQNKNIKKICMAGIIIAIVLSILKSYFHNSLLSIMLTLFMHDYIQTFIAGIMLFCLYKNHSDILPHIVILLCIINHYINRGAGYTVFFTVVIAILYCVVYGVKIKTPLDKSIIFIAKVSYPLYLTHQFIGYGIIHLIESFGFTNEVFLIIPFTISIVLAYLLNRFIEEPSAKVLKRVNPFDKGKLKESIDSTWIDGINQN